MTSGSSLDTSYRADPRIVTKIRTVDSVTILHAGASFELPLALFQVLVVFADGKTVQEAFDAVEVEVDVELEDFRRIVDGFVARGLLRSAHTADDGRDLRQLLNPQFVSDPALLDKASRWLRDGRALVIPDALSPDFAEDIHRDLDRAAQWRVAEGGHDFFHYRNSMIDDLEARSPALAECSRLFQSTATRRFVGELSGADCSGKANVAAAWYRPTEYALPHNDTASGDPRSVAYIWYLTKDWRREWGGSLFWCPTGQYISPRFNVLLIFKVTPSNVHFICPVAPTATSKRMTISGFWSPSERDASSPAAEDPGAFISPRAYGPEAPGNDPECSQIIAL